MSSARQRAGAVVTLAGVAAVAPSVWQTATHITDETYRAPQVRHGEGHVQYHMAREVLITAGSVGVLVTGVLAGRDRSPAVWRGMVAAAAGIGAAMWSGGPTTGVWAPNRKALLVHLASTTGLGVGVALLRPKAEHR
ncbi:hypothetical protein ACIGXM_33985 [Kitasatospora sp. NPDC052896]|uniref:hypothetical protein n=1 Tax=Kitasatospora sp. NPDC052896 TaxID=3364061 RepID=UPI0037C54F23